MIRRFFSLRLAFLFLALLVAGAAACGPSFQAVYECDVRFEHCYAMDENPVSREAKRDCWRTWLGAYTYGQSRDRVDYATTRVTQLSLDPSALAEATNDGGLSLTSQAAVAPVPTNAFAPPPNVATPDAGAPARVATFDSGARAPDADCSDACTRHWASCHDGCGDAGAAKTTRGSKALTCSECDRAYKICVPACFGSGAVSANARPHTAE